LGLRENPKPQFLTPDSQFLTMSVLLPNRDTHLSELMDDPSCDVSRLNNTYKQFHVVNQFLSGWYRIYATYLKPRLASGSTVLDIGCGGGDVLRNVAVWSRRDGLEVSFTGIDPDARALEYARSCSTPPNMQFYQASSRKLVQAGKKFDIIISNHVLHHLQNDEVYALCKDSEQLANAFVLHNDIRRSGLAYAGFSLTKLIFRKSFTTEDGLLSIRRSFTAGELQKIVPPQWRVKPMIPYRNLLIYEKSSSSFVVRF
jgi:2-polyprenyl-3-methyl-5-hydroxy-6-metoxy-1,4-benzoquinol methylase